MSAVLTAAVTAAIKALPKTHKARKALQSALSTRADFSARGRKAWSTRRKARKSRARR